MTSFWAGLNRFLQNCGISQGDTLVFEFTGDLHSTIAPELLAGLQDLVSERGLLVVPTCSHHEGMPKPAFHLHDTPSEMGPFSEYFRLQPGVIRSNHPTHSLAAWGNDAKRVTSGHRYAYGRQTPWGESALGMESPWDRLVSRDAWWVVVDPDWHNSPLAAYASALLWERSVGITKETPFLCFSPAWLNTYFARAAGAQQLDIDDRRVLVFRLRQALAGLEQASNRAADGIFEGPAYQRWRQSRQWVEANGYLLAGVNKTCITPSLPFARWDGKPITGLYRNLYARTVFLKSGTQHFALVLCDLLGITREIVAEVRRRIQVEYPLENPAVMIACTHAHSTPDTIAAGFCSAEYQAFLVEQLVSSIAAAYQSLRPARMGWSKTAIRGIAHSRRWKLKDGGVFTTRYGVPSTWRVSPQQIAAQGIIDPELTVLRIECLNGSPLAVITNFGVHPSIALASSLASGDFAGETMHILEQVYGPGTLALCTTGAAADVDPTAEMPVWGPRNEQNAVRIARLFAAQVLDALERTKVQEMHEIRVTSREMLHGLRTEWINLVTRDVERMQSEYAEGRHSTPYIGQMVAAGACSLEVQAVRLNDLVLLAFPGEVFTTTSLWLKEHSAAPLAVLETTNDYAGYLYPRQEFQEGGYECSLHFATRLHPTSEEVLRESAMDALRELNA